MRNISLTSRWAIALTVSAATTLGTAMIMVPSGSADVVVQVVCTAPAWAEGNSYTVGQQVTYNGRLYQALQAHTAWPGAGWNPASTPTLWSDLGACDGGQPTSRPPSATASPSRPPSPSPSMSRPPSSPPPSSPAPSSAPPTGGT